MSLPTATIRAIMRSGSAEPEEATEMALEILNRRHLDRTDVDFKPIRVCLQPVMSDVDPDHPYGCKILSDNTGDERAFEGWYTSELEAVEMARSILDGEIEVGCNDLLVLT